MADMPNNICFIMQGRMELENNEKSRKYKKIQENKKKYEQIDKIEGLRPLRKKHIGINI